jgi:hypothetical protein
VYANATLAVGSGVTSTASEGTGAYQVIFNQNVRNCSYEGTLGIPGPVGSGIQPAGFITTAPRATSVDGVWINTYDSTGTAADEPFNLAVFC